MNNATSVKPVLHDSAAWHAARNAAIKASRAAGKVHLDRVPRFVEDMRGRAIYCVHDTKIRGVLRTVDRHGNVLVDWSDEYSANKELATPVWDGKRTAYRSMLGVGDLRDYALS